MNVLRNIRGSANYSNKPIVYKCMSCGKIIENASGIYERRFCSAACKERYIHRSTSKDDVEI